MNATPRWLHAALALALLGGGCSATRIGNPPSLAEDLARIESDLDLMPPLPRPERASGSIWTDAGPGAAMNRDTRAYRINDLVTIVVAERSAGQNDADTALTRASSANFGAGVAFGLEDPSPQTGKFNLNQVLNASSSSDFSGDGSTSRANSVTSTMTTRVMRVLPNGDLLVAGQKTVTVNRERQILTLVGTIRPVDINADNRVSSAEIGDLTIRLWGQGEIADSVRQGWFVRMMNKIWPF